MTSLLARVLGAIAWRIPGNAARKLASFADAERSSMVDLQQAAGATGSVERAGRYLRHASDEARHARLFARRSAELRRADGKRPLGEPRADVDDLFAVLGEVGFLAFVHRGERRGRQQFEAYRDHFAGRGADTERALFEAILVDERRHEAYTYELLVELAGGERKARAALRRAGRWELWRLWRRAGRRLAHAVYSVAMVALYVAALPAAIAVKLSRRSRPGWRLPGK